LWISLSLISLFGFVATLLFGHQDLFTALFGLRVWLIHFPLIFLYAEVFTIKDVWRVARLLLFLALPMAVLMYLQGTLPETHFLNQAAGGEGAALFAGAAGKQRPPGIFTFISGLSTYMGLSLALAIGWLLAGPRPIPLWTWWGLLGLAAALPLSISRTALFLYWLVGFATVAYLLLARRGLVRFMSYVLVLLLLLIPLLSLPQFQPFTHAFETRWEQATEFEAGEKGVAGVLGKRVFAPFLKPLEQVWVVPMLGEGLGLGTNVGATRFTGTTGFLVGEDAWEATLGELGPILGMGVLLIRIGLTGAMLMLSLREATRGNPVPLLLASVLAQRVLNGQPGQPISLSFMVIGGGLLLAACRSPASGIRYRTFLVAPPKRR
jgi:hypothetical protein